MKKIQLSIPEPCQQNWHDMTPTQQGRFCNACVKEIIDFSMMSDSEVLNYFSKVKNEEICGRAFPDQLDRAITAPAKKKLFWYWNYAVAFFLFFGKASRVKSQMVGMMLPSKTDTVTIIHSRKAALKKHVNNKILFEGIIQDENGQPVPFATVKLLHSHNGAEANEQGRFVIGIDCLNCTLEVSSLNYETQRITVNDLLEKKIVLKKTTRLMEGVVVNCRSSENIRMGGMVRGICVGRSREKRTIKDTVNRLLNCFNPSVKVYPNPLPKGNAFIVALTLKQTGNYILRITDAAGRIVAEKKIDAISKQHSEQLQSGNEWSSGLYYVSLINEKGKSAGTVTLTLQ